MSANRILIVEDDPSISETVSLSLGYVGYKCSVISDGDDVVEYLKNDDAFDLVLLDIMLPGISGLDLLAHFKKRSIPVIFLTAKSDSVSEVRGLQDGAEDYIVKPFEMVTLLVRIEKVLSRTGKLNNIYCFKNITVDASNRDVKNGGEPIALAPLEFSVFLMLLRNKNRTISRKAILNEIWGEDWTGNPRTVDVRIANIRKKLGLANDLRSIPTIGYRLEENRS